MYASAERLTDLRKAQSLTLRAASQALVAPAVQPLGRPSDHWSNCFAKQIQRSSNRVNNLCFRPMSWKLTCTSESCSAFRRQNVFQCIPLGLLPEPLMMPAGQPRRFLILSACRVARSLQRKTLIYQRKKPSRIAP